MDLYDKYVLPKLINFTCSQKPIMYQRKKVVPLAAGRVLEVGIGSGLNLPFYNIDTVESIWGLDPSEPMQKAAKKQAVACGLNVNFLSPADETIPLEQNSMDTILITYTLCTITHLKKTLEEMRRVLKPSGKLIFCEHGRAPDKHIQKWQDRLNPLWRIVSGGCNLNRYIPGIIEQGGFKIKKLEAMYITGYKIASFNYWGFAVQR